MSMPDHGEFDENVPGHATIDMAITFLDLYCEDGDRRNFDAALTMLERVYRNTFPIVAVGLVQEIEAAATPPAAHEPHFSDRAEPGPVVPIAIHQPLISPIPRPDEIDE